MNQVKAFCILFPSADLVPELLCLDNGIANAFRVHIHIKRAVLTQMETWPRYDKVIDSFSSVWNKQSPSPITSRRLNKMRVLFEMTKNMLKQLDMYELLQRVFISRQPSLPASRMSQANFDCPVNLTLIPAYSFRVLCRACEVHFGGHCAFGAAWN